MLATPPKRPEHQPTRTKPVSRAATIRAAFGYAFAGIRHLLWTQRNAQIHCAIGTIAVALGLALQISRGEWLVLVLTIGLVLTMEGVNTAVEAVVDLATPHYHPLAKIAKDVAAGTVLLAAITSVVIGLIIFVPYLWPIARTLLGL